MTSDLPTRTTRQHRKQLSVSALWHHVAALGPPRRVLAYELNIWIGSVFAVGATLFAVACVAALWPDLVPAELRPEAAVNRVFFLGSIPFTIAAGLQLLQAELAGEFPHGPANGAALDRPPWGWRLADPGWLACAFQFGGTLMFNVNTFDAMYAPDQWWLQDVEIWAPDLLGSILFLASGGLAAREIWQQHGYWRPQSIEWVIGGINLLGCIAFMIAVVFAVYTPQALPFNAAGYAVGFTLIGALCFLLGALLLMLEAGIDAHLRTARKLT